MAERRASVGMEFYRPAEVAKVLRCSEWWIKEQARRGRIPFSWIGGSYLFTAAHIAEIVLQFERRPSDFDSSATGAISAPRSRSARREQSGIRLKARIPRRSRVMDEPKQSDAA